MSTRRFLTNLLIVFLVIVILVLVAIIGFDWIDSNRNDSQPNVTDIPVVQITTQPTVHTTVSTVTNTPWIPTIVTTAPESVATATPEVWYIVTVAPTVKPVITVTPMPTTTHEPVITATPVPTATPVVTINPTETPIVTNTPTATPVVTNPPTQAPTPTQQVTEAPPKYTKEALEIARKELYKLTGGGVNEILPDCVSNRKYDLYNYITLDKINPYELFNILKDIYINTMAHSFDFNFDYCDGIEGLEIVLNSAYCPTCGRLEITYKRENDAKMISLLDSIKYDDIVNANMIMLNFLYNNSYVSNDNINERLVICCSCNN